MNRTALFVLEIFLLALLVIRPALDIFTDVYFHFGPVALNPAGLLSLALIGVGALWFFSLPGWERNAVITQPITAGLCIWVLALLPLAFIPLWRVEAAPMAGLKEWVRLLSFLPVALLATALVLRNKGSWLLWVFALGFIFPAVTGIQQIADKSGMIIREVHRVAATFVHPNQFAFYLVLIAGVAYASWRVRLNSWMRSFWLLLAVGLLISTYSFTGALMFGTLVFICAIGENTKLRTFAIALLVVFAGIFLATPSGMQRVKEVTQIDRLDHIEATGEETSSVTWRLLNWRYLYREWVKQPVIGYGLDSSQHINPNYNQYEETGHLPHNDYVRYLVETGGVGLLYFVLLMVAVACTLIQGIRHADNNLQKILLWAALGIFASWAVGSLGDNLISATAYQYCLWLVLAGAGALACTEETA